MNNLKRIAPAAWVAACVASTLAPSTAWAQDEEFRAEPVAASQAEFNAMDALELEQNPITQLTSAAAFLETYPESEFTHLVHRVRIQAYDALGNFDSAIAAAEAALASETAFVESRRAAVAERGDAEAPDLELDFANSRTFYYRALMDAHNQRGDSDDVIRYATLGLESNAEAEERLRGTTDDGADDFDATIENHRAIELYLTQTIMVAYQNLNDAEQTIVYAERALELNPDDLATLLTLSSVMAERPPEEGDARERHLERAEEHAENAIEMLERFLDGPAGAGMDAGQADALRSSVHSTLGLIYLHQEEFGDAQDEYETALDAVPADPIAYFRLGFAYAQDDEADDAMEALARSVSLGGVTASEARGLLERIYEAENGSLDGLDAFIEEEGGRIGNE